MGKLKRGKENQGKKIGISESVNKSLLIEHPIFCFKYLHKDFHIDKIDCDGKGSLLGRFCQLSEMTWGQIQLAHKHGLGSEKISINSINPGIPSEIKSKTDHFISLRYQGKKPIVGYRNGNVFHIIYIDYNFSVYPH